MAQRQGRTAIKYLAFYTFHPKWVPRGRTVRGCPIVPSAIEVTNTGRVLTQPSPSPMYTWGHSKSQRRTELKTYLTAHVALGRLLRSNENYRRRISRSFSASLPPVWPVPWKCDGRPYKFLATSVGTIL